jgi:tape measure domain-containing protein
VAIAGTLSVNIKADTTQLEHGMGRARREIQETAQSATHAQSSFAGLGTALTGLAAGVLSVNALKSAVTDLMRTGLELQNLRHAFTAIAGSAQAGNLEFGFIIRTAKALGIGVKELAESYRGLSAATRGTALEGAGTRDLFTALTGASKTYGLSTEQTGRALVAFQQIISKGKVSQEELRQQLGEAIPGASQIAARAFGVTTAELDKLIEKGVDGLEFAKRFATQLKQEVPVAAEIAGKGMAQLGHEILLLKERMAQSGLLAFLDSASAKLAGLLKADREFAAQRERLLGGPSPTLPENASGGGVRGDCGAAESDRGAARRPGAADGCPTALGCPLAERHRGAGARSVGA